MKKVILLIFAAFAPIFMGIINAATTFTAKLSVNNRTENSEVDATFQILTDVDNDRTCAIVANKGPLFSNPTIDSKTEGALTVPQSVEHNSVNYTIVKIGDNSFSGCKKLTSVTLPATITEIGVSAFQNCPSLISITGIGNVKTIGDMAFNSCSSLKDIDFPESLISIGRRSFQVCTKLETVNNKSKITTIPESAFDGCSSLTSFTFNDELTTIGDYAFQNSGLTSVTLPDGISVSGIGKDVFKGCTLDKVYYHGKDANLITSAFDGATVKEWDLGDVTEIFAYQYQNSEKETFEVPDGITTISTGAFQGSTKLTKVTIPSSVKYIQNDVFKGCTALTDIEFTGSPQFTRISSSTFEGCTSLKSITIPASVTEIGDNAFKDCSSLTTINIEGKLTSIGKGVFRGTKITSLPALPEGLKVIDDNAFRDVTTLTDITLPVSVERIGNNAFQGCTGIKTISLTNIKSIGEYAFSGSGLTSVTLPSGLIGIEETNSSGVVQSSYISLGTYAFADCADLKDVTIEDGVTTLPERVFNGCTSLTKIVLPASITTVGQYAFAGCSNLEYIDATEATGFKPNNVLRNWNTNPGSSVSWPLGSVPNSTLVYLPKGFSLSQELIAPNTILSTDEGKTCSDYRITANKSLDIPYAFTADKVTVTGLKSGAKTTLVLPFAIDKVSELGKFYEYAGNDDANVSFNGVNSVDAWKAYLVEPSATSISVNKSTEVGATSSYSTTDESGLVGVLTSTNAPDNAYVLSGENFVKANATTVSPTQAYLVPGTATTSESLAITTVKAPTNPEGTTITIGEGGLSTFTSDIDVDFSSWESAGVKAYVATGYDPASDDFIMQRVPSIRAGQGVVLKGDANTQVKVTASSDPIYTLNLMKGVNDDVTIGGTADGYTNFRLTNGDNGITFYTFTRNVSLLAGQAYLQIPTDVATKATSNGAKGLKLEFVDGETTGISVINGEIQRKQSDAIYDLQGRRVSKPQKGIYIVNGKKVVIK